MHLSVIKHEKLNKKQRAHACAVSNIKNYCQLYTNIAAVIFIIFIIFE